MKSLTTKENWQTYCAAEIKTVTPILAKLGYLLDETQPHTQGERYLMRAVTTTHGQKLILLGKRQRDNQPVVIKVSNDPAGIEEIKHERTCRAVLHQINFAYNIFSSPKELLHKTRAGYVINIQEFITQEKTFMERSTPEQFKFAIEAFKAQEGARASTYKHQRTIKKTFALRNQKMYLSKFADFQSAIEKSLPNKTDLIQTLARAKSELEANTTIIEQYGEFLTHTDFVPHNFRIKDHFVYLLDHSSLTFGNKYEGWARFINFMTLYNPELQKALEKYVSDNRSDGEVTALAVMRIYRLGEIIYYYVDKLDKSDGNLLKLNRVRVDFWRTVLEHVLDKSAVPSDIITTYQTTRDQLRSEDEKERQKGLH